jgi:hypothetical protein
MTTSKMIPSKSSTNRQAYIKLHYALQKAYRKKYPYIPFRYIQRKISRQWQLRCYHETEKQNCEVQEPPKKPVLTWSETIETVKIIS